MRVEDIQSYEDLEKYIRMELAVQTLKKRTMQLELNEIWFFKLAKLIKFALKNEENEKYAKEEVTKECKKYILKINKVFTVVTRK